MSQLLQRKHQRFITCTGLNGQDEPSNVLIRFQSQHGMGATKFALCLDDKIAWLTPEEWRSLCVSMSAEAEMSMAVDVELKKLDSSAL